MQELEHVKLLQCVQVGQSQPRVPEHDAQLFVAAGYQLLVYGNKRQDEMYCAKCERLITKLGMQEHVFLKGVAKPSEILRQGWMYLQVCIDAS